MNGDRSIVECVAPGIVHNYRRLSSGGRGFKHCTHDPSLTPIFALYLNEAEISANDNPTGSTKLPWIERGTAASLEQQTDYASHLCPSGTSAGLGRTLDIEFDFCKSSNAPTPVL